MCNKGITQFYLPPTHEPYLPLLLSRKASPPLGLYRLILLGEHIGVEKLDHSFYAVCPTECRTQELLMASPTLYRQCSDATTL